MKILILLIVICSLKCFASITPYEEEMNERQHQLSFSTVAKEFMRLDFIRDDVRQIKDFAKNKVNQIAQKTGKFTLALLGAGVKTLIEKRFYLRGRLIKKNNTKYAISSDFDDVSVRIFGDTPWSKKTSYNLNVGTQEVSVFFAINL